MAKHTTFKARLYRKHHDSSQVKNKRQDSRHNNHKWKEGVKKRWENEVKEKLRKLRKAGSRKSSHLFVLLTLALCKMVSFSDEMLSGLFFILAFVFSWNNEHVSLTHRQSTSDAALDDDLTYFLCRKSKRHLWENIRSLEILSCFPCICPFCHVMRDGWSLREIVFPRRLLPSMLPM